MKMSIIQVDKNIKRTVEYYMISCCSALSTCAICMPIGYTHIHKDIMQCNSCIYDRMQRSF